ncbi:Leucine rich repeat variant [Leifsonia rubra CMS 76R]|nr:Leucine rich repeat variant [Leifsonia rubra CMS 76R]
MISTVRNPTAPVATVEFLSRGDWVARRTTTKSDREDGHTSTWTVWDDYATDAAKEDMARLVRAEISRRRWLAGGQAFPLNFAKNQDASPEILDELADDPDETVRCAVAANQSTTPETFIRLTADSVDQVRFAAAGASHPDSAAKSRDRSYDESPRREDFYAQAFERLAGDKHARVRAAVVSNPAAWSSISTSSRSKQAFDADPAVRSALVATLTADDERTDSLGLSKDALLHLVETGTPDIWRFLASRYRLPRKVLKRLLETGDSETAVLIVTNTAATELLVLLASSDDVEVVDAVAERRFYGPEETGTKIAVAAAMIRNSLAPSSFVDGAAHDAVDEESLDIILQHPNISEALLLQFARGTDERKLRAVARANHAGPKRAIAENAATPADLLESLAVDADETVREALLINPSTPSTVLVQLIQSREA